MRFQFPPNRWAKLLKKSINRDVGSQKFSNTGGGVFDTTAFENRLDLTSQVFT